MVNVAIPGVVEPIAPGAAKVAPPSVAALILELHDNPVPDVHPKALEDVLQLGAEMAVGLAVEPLALAIIVFAD